MRLGKNNLIYVGFKTDIWGGEKKNQRIYTTVKWKFSLLLKVRVREFTDFLSHIKPWKSRTSHTGRDLTDLPALMDATFIQISIYNLKNFHW